MPHADTNGQKLHLEDLPIALETGEHTAAGLGD
jgi:hypothetical protein